MSDGKLFGRTKSAELRAELDQALTKSKPHTRVKVVLKKIVSNIILNNNELVKMYKDVIPLMKMDDLEIRLMCLQYVVNYSPMDPKEASLALPYLARFCTDHSSALRALAIKALSSIPNEEFVDKTFQLLPQLLHDNDIHVRKSAIYSISRLYEHAPERTMNEGLIDELNEMLYDENAFIVSNSLAALNNITENSKGLTLKINKSHSMDLISLLSKCNEWSQVYIINSLMAYVPQSSNEAIELIEAIMDSLQHENSAVVLNSIKVITYFSNYVDNVELILPNLPNRISSSLILMLSKPAEVQFLVLRNIILLLLGKKELVDFDVELFFCKYDDPIYIKDTKLEIIFLLANENNVDIVLRELEEYATEVDVSMARKAVRAFGNIAIKLTGVSDACVEVLCDLIATGISYIVEESAVVLKNIIRKYPNSFNYSIEVMLNHYDVVEDPDAKVSLLWMLGQFGEKLDNTMKILNALLLNFKDEADEVKFAALTTVTKLYLKMPSQAESIMIELLRWATEEADNPDIRDRGLFYWRLLSSDSANGKNDVFQECSKRIILNDNPIIYSGNDNIDPSILEELELNIGTIGSIYLKPIQNVFRKSKAKKLPKSPALKTKALPTPPTSDKPSPISSDYRNSPNLLKKSFTPPRKAFNENFLDIGRKNNSSDGLPPFRNRSKNTSIRRQKSFDAGLLMDQSEPSKINSFARKLTRKASLMGTKSDHRF